MWVCAQKKGKGTKMFIILSLSTFIYLVPLIFLFCFAEITVYFLYEKFMSPNSNCESFMSLRNKVTVREETRKKVKLQQFQEKAWRLGLSICWHYPGTRKHASFQHCIGERFLAPYSAIINAAILCGRCDIVCSRRWEPGLHLLSCYASWFHAVLLLSWAFQHQNPIISTPNPHSVRNCFSLQKANGISCSHLP